MAKGGKCEYDDVMRFRANLERLQGRELDALARRICDKIAETLVSDVKKNTPVGVGTKNPGNLRRSWNWSAVYKAGDHWTVTVYNTANYAIYVEYGHRTRNHKSWVEGRFMLTNAKKRLDRKARIIIAEEVKKKLGEMFG